METTENLLEKLSGKITEVYDVKLIKELSDIFVKLADQIKEDDRKYFSLAKKLAMLQMRCEKLEKERGQAE